MDAEEMKDRLKSVINSLIKDNAEESKNDLHDVLAAKMRDRISPPTTEDDDSGNDPVVTDDESANSSAE
jgi:hypothetical protein